MKHANILSTIAFLMKVVFLSLFSPAPRLGLVDLGRSEITVAVRQLDGIEVTLVRTASELRELVMHHDLDAGLVLESGFDEAVRAGKRPLFEFYLSGESRVTDRIVLGVTAIDLVRGIEGRTPPVEVVLNHIGGDSGLPVFDLAVLSVLLFALLITGVFATAFMLVQEREQRTLGALLVTPARLSEIMLSKAAIGFVMVIVMCTLTLLISGARTAHPGALFVTLSAAAVVCVEIGLIYGLIAPEAKALYTMFKTLNLFILGPLIFYFFPNWPQWPARIFPTYWFIDPLYRIALKGASLGEVQTDLFIALGIGLMLFLPIVLLARRIREKLAAA